MAPLLILLLSCFQLLSITQAEQLASPRNGLNNFLDGLDDGEEENNLSALLPPELPDQSIESGSFGNGIVGGEAAEGDLPFVRAGHDQTEVEFRHPIASVNIDYSKNVIVLKFRKDGRGKLHHRKVRDDELEKRRALESNFMRFGRSPNDFLRFGKRQAEELPFAGVDGGDFEGEGRLKDRIERSSYDNSGMRDSRGDNFMRFGRSAGQDFMRFGRTAAADFMRLGRTPSTNFMRLGRLPNAQDYMRFGRSPADFMRFGRAGSDNFMRLGRLPGQDFMRFGRAPYGDNSFMRFGRPDNFMRFGRSPQDGGADQSGNFMRFGKSSNSADDGHNQTNNGAQQQKHEIRETAKLLHQTQKAGDDNPMDKAMQVLFSQHQRKDDARAKSEQERQEQHEHKSHGDDGGDGNGDGNTESDLDDAFNLDK